MTKYATIKKNSVNNMQTNIQSITPVNSTSNTNSYG